MPVTNAIFKTGVGYEVVVVRDGGDGFFVCFIVSPSLQNAGEMQSEYTHPIGALVHIRPGQEPKYTPPPPDGEYPGIDKEQYIKWATECVEELQTAGE